MKHIKVENFGPIGLADVEYGDLTILVGAQASGKSLFLELTKLMVDKESIVNNLRKYNYIIGKNDQANLLDIYFGNGMSKAWNADTRVAVDCQGEIKGISIPAVIAEGAEERMFYIPAQRILSMSDGRPKAFSEFDSSCPYVLRQFSETLRLFMASGFDGKKSVLFPISTRLKKYQRDSFNDSIFHDGKVEMDVESGQRKMKLKVDGMEMPFMTWSAGQKEFMPLLMGFYCVSGSPTRVFNKEQYEYVVIEEPEMGLHPQAIKAVLLQIIELIQSGYKVILSTHSSVPLEFVWAFNILKTYNKKGREQALYKLFDKNGHSRVAFKGIFDKSIRTYFFHRKDGVVSSVDISSLDASSEDVNISEWGGLSNFATEAADVVGQFCD